MRRMGEEAESLANSRILFRYVLQPGWRFVTKQLIFNSTAGTAQHGGRVHPHWHTAEILGAVCSLGGATRPV